MEQNINKWVHQLILQHIKPEHIAIDATCGNGHDTLFLARHCKQVYAFDIQAQAIESTARTVHEHHITNVILLHQSHDTLIDNIPTNVDIVMYNLGYLPYGDRQIITTPKTTLASLQQAIKLLTINGLITLTIYTGHDGGSEESLAIESYLKTLDKHDFTIQKTTYLNRNQSPYVLAIQKVR